ncbi:hypothetical protein ACIBHY_38760 [Nonomuraea sp. NPDC050547]|uniref:hypothetical protein n=1 Tax=unclassified Nonomuraea TaxID=2593643 RepID=UPI0037A23D8B
MDRGRVRRLAEDLTEQGVPPLAQALEKIVGLRVIEAAPTAFTLSLFAACAEAEGYLAQRVRRRLQRVTEAGAKLMDGRQNWKRGEDASTVSPGTFDA